MLHMKRVSHIYDVIRAALSDRLIPTLVDFGGSGWGGSAPTTSFNFVKTDSMKSLDFLAEVGKFGREFSGVRKPSKNFWDLWFPLTN